MKNAMKYELENKPKTKGSRISDSTFSVRNIRHEHEHGTGCIRFQIRTISFFQSEYLSRSETNVGRCICVEGSYGKKRA